VNSLNEHVPPETNADYSGKAVSFDSPTVTGQSKERVEQRLPIPAQE
jgi:hypothetical protein